MLVQQVADALVDIGQPPLQRNAGTGLDDALGDRLQPRAHAADDAVAGAGGARIDAQYKHGADILRGRADAFTGSPGGVEDRCSACASAAQPPARSAVLADCHSLRLAHLSAPGSAQGAGRPVRVCAALRGWRGAGHAAGPRSPCWPPPTRSSTGRTADIVWLNGMSIARDGTGGLVYLKDVDGVAHVFVSLPAQNGAFQAPGPGRRRAARPLLTAGDRRRQHGPLLVGFINDGAAVRRPSA